MSERNRLVEATEGSQTVEGAIAEHQDFSEGEPLRSENSPVSKEDLRRSRVLRGAIQSYIAEIRN